MYSLIGTAKLNDVDPPAWLADMLARIADHPVLRLQGLLPWHWREGRNKTDHPVRCLDELLPLYWREDHDRTAVPA